MFEPIYAWVESGVEAWIDVLGTDKLGDIDETGVVLMQPVDGMLYTYAITFDTEDTVFGPSCITGYIIIEPEDEIEWLDEAETLAYLEELQLYRLVDETVIPMIEFDFEPKCEMEEHFHLAECYDELGELICELPVHEHDADCRFAPAPVIPETTEEPEVPAEPEASVEPETSVEPEASEEPEVTEEPEASAEPTVEPTVEPDPTEKPLEDLKTEDNLVKDEIVLEQETELIPDQLVEEDLIPDATEEPEMPEVPEVNAEDDTAEEVVAQRSIKVTISEQNDENGILYIGDSVVLTAELNGFDGLGITCEWECAPIDETGAVCGEWAATGVTGLTHSFVADEDNLMSAWRLRVTIVE